MTASLIRTVSATLLASALHGCVLAPKETPQERQRLATAGEVYARPIAERPLPRLPERPGWHELLQYAFAANGELEAAHAEWRAAMERVTIAAGYPNTKVQLGFQYLFSGGQMKAWDRTTLTAGTDSMLNLSLPIKTMAAGRVALEDARFAGERFRGAKFDLQRRVLEAYYDYALLAERRRLQEELVHWAGMSTASVAARLLAGGGQGAMAEAHVFAELAANDLQAIEAEMAQRRALLNGLIGRPADAVLLPPESLPQPRPRPDDVSLLTSVAENNPDLTALAAVARSRDHAVYAAKLQFLPDINPSAGLTGSATQMIGAAAMLPTTVPQIRAAIRESQAMLLAVEAQRRQTGADRSAQAIAAFSALRDAERQIELFENRIQPAIDMSARATQAAYTSGSTDLAPFLDSQRSRLEARAQLAALRMARERRLAELEALAGLDLETLQRGAVESIARPQEVDHER